MRQLSTGWRFGVSSDQESERYAAYRGAGPSDEDGSVRLGAHLRVIHFRYLLATAMVRSGAVSRPVKESSVGSSNQPAAHAVSCILIGDFYRWGLITATDYGAAEQACAWVSLS